MPTFRDPADRAAIVARLDRLTEQMPPKWGRFTAAKMLAHMTDACRMALGELPVRRRNIPLIDRFPVKHLVLYVLPFPKNSPTAREIISRMPEPFDAERTQLKALITQLDGNTGKAPHPIFGLLTPNEWGVLGYKHLDHHLRQFGV